MLVQALREVTLPDGRVLRHGEVAQLSDAVAAPLLRSGAVRERIHALALEYANEGAGIPRPLKATPEIESPTLGPDGTVLSWQNEDNFIRNLVTVGYPGGCMTLTVPPDLIPGIEIPLTPSGSGREPVLTVDEIKSYLRIDPDYNEEDCTLEMLEQSARAACENALRRVGQIDSSCGENIKQAMLWDIGFAWEHRDPANFPPDYNREWMFRRWLAGEVDYPDGVY
jgi:hypothetical protein